MELSLHKVKRIYVDAPTKGTISFFRTLVITEENGNELEIILFASDFGKLLIKKE